MGREGKSPKHAKGQSVKGAWNFFSALEAREVAITFNKRFALERPWVGVRGGGVASGVEKGSKGENR